MALAVVFSQSNRKGTMTPTELVPVGLFLAEMPLWLSGVPRLLLTGPSSATHHPLGSCEGFTRFSYISKWLAKYVGTNIGDYVN